MRGGRFDVDAVDDASLRSGLVGDEALAEHRFRRGAHLMFVLAQPDAAGLAARPGMDLRLDDPARSADFVGAIHRLIRAVGDAAVRHGDAEFREQFFGLVFVDIHRCLWLRTQDCRT